jgi:hypothetical protein
LQANHNRDLVPRLSGTNVVTRKWIFKQKLKADGSLDRYKAHWVLRGFTQHPEVDYDKTFNPMVKPGTIHTILTLALSQALTSRMPSPWQPDRDYVLHSAGRLCGPGSPRLGLQAQPVTLLPQAGVPSLVQSLCHLTLIGLRRGQRRSQLKKNPSAHFIKHKGSCTV